MDDLRDRMIGCFLAGYTRRLRRASGNRCPNCVPDFSFDGFNCFGAFEHAESRYIDLGEFEIALAHRFVELQGLLLHPVERRIAVLLRTLKADLGV